MDYPSTGTITFVERHAPALLNGTYAVTVEHTLSSAPGALKSGHEIDCGVTNTRTFEVAGPSFTLAPDQIAGLFPPANSQGEYATALPHVALGRLTLPWERAADAAGTLPWLAVLVIDAAENVAAVDAQIGDLQHDPFLAAPGQTRASTLAASSVSYAETAPLVLDPGQTLADRCRVIDLPADLFAALAPSADDLRWLAYTRIASGPAGDSAQSFVVANRMPPGGAHATAHLVSLEGLGAYLPRSDGAESTTSAIRLAVLASWSFSALDPADTFSGRLLHIPCGVARLPDPTTNAGNEDAVKLARRALRAGYCALSHRTRAGDDTLAWYRGPLLPCAPPSDVLPQPISSAEQLLHEDPATGMLDISYATAWQLGRQLAISDAGFSSRLRAWKASLAEQAALAVQRAMTAERVGGALDLAGAAALLRTTVANALQAAPATAEASATTTPGAPMHERLTALVSNRQELAAQHADAELPEPLASWLAELARLRRVPLGYLVPDPRMLPSPAIRFFRIDPNWITALVEGAFSLARTSSAQAAHDEAAAVTAGIASAAPLSGFLLRSPVVDDCPDLDVLAFGSSGLAGSHRRRIAPGMLICLVDDVIEHVELREPPGVLHLDLSEKVPRYVTVPKGSGAQPGSDVPGAAPLGAALPVRTGPGAVVRVIEIDTLAQQLEQAVGKAHANEETDGSARPFTAAELALQLTAGSEAVSFHATAP